jgi:triosephosphate isomerase
MSKIILGNWKMHGSRSENAPLIDAFDGRVTSKDRVGVCVPFPYLAQAYDALVTSAVKRFAQDVSVHENGAYTGEVSAAMLADYKCHGVIVGHSERRAYHAETDEIVAAKAKIALAHGLIPVVCVGETLAEHEKGDTVAVITRQLSAVLNALTDVKNPVFYVAYEPVWAIGTGRAANVNDITAAHTALRQLLNEHNHNDTPLLYGGSVKAANAAEILSLDLVDGALVGGASLNAEEFLAIIEAARH